MQSKMYAWMALGTYMLLLMPACDTVINTMQSPRTAPPIRRSPSIGNRLPSANLEWQGGERRDRLLQGARIGGEYIPSMNLRLSGGRVLSLRFSALFLIALRDLSDCARLPPFILERIQ